MDDRRFLVCFGVGFGKVASVAGSAVLGAVGALETAGWLDAARVAGLLFSFEQLPRVNKVVNIKTPTKAPAVWILPGRLSWPSPRVDWFVVVFISDRLSCVIFSSCVAPDQVIAGGKPQQPALIRLGLPAGQISKDVVHETHRGRLNTQTAARCSDGCSCRSSTLLFFNTVPALPVVSSSSADGPIATARDSGAHNPQ